MFRRSGHILISSRNVLLQLRPFTFTSATNLGENRPGTDSVSGAVSHSIAEETQDVASIDSLFEAVRKRSNPEYNSLVPIRPRRLWSEVLLTSEPTSMATSSSSNQPPDLTPRNMHDSYTEIVLPFSSSTELYDKYTNASGGIRTGKLMEHLDSLAGSIAYKHMLGPGVQTLGKIHERGFYIVTAAVERLDMLGQLNPQRDLRLSGEVIYTGRSSMEVVVKMETMPGSLEEKDETIMLGRFSMVCRDANTHKARQVNPLMISTPEEKALYAMGETLKAKRLTNAQRSLSRVPPSSVEAAALHSSYLKYSQQKEHQEFDDDLVYMSDTRAEKCMLMFPQERNLHGKIFGGYLMRLAYELGFLNASLFSKGPVRFLALDGISFARPVPIGSILRLTSYILHSTSSEHYPMLIHVGVTANVVDIETGSEQITNEFRFTWCKEHGTETRKVVPRTYREAMLWLEGRRALEIGEAFRGLRTIHH
ncbi:hypothetical protein E1B28_013495 [Marasmius oreades]|uniref:HotDog ACOT-type domain-containing protein n=1 Tax=Marasmius oreades TaxID=181124 RepID=A0A9P7RR43_9AGAR|nr:uncharacterized protein E1B28_013495 [Marasmius oreades]KAG7087538.1 hypothetical protein E1B28_013495 [Marasmius oreades]